MKMNVVCEAVQIFLLHSVRRGKSEDEVGTGKSKVRKAQHTKEARALMP